MKRWPQVVLICLATLMAACQPTSVQYDRNILVTDSSGLVENVSWGRSPAMADPFFPDDIFAVLLETHEPRLIEIALNGSTGCPQFVDAAVIGDENALRVELELSESVPIPGTECLEDLTTYALVFNMREPVVFESIELFARVSDD
jgi:hypothetical protein